MYNSSYPTFLEIPVFQSHQFVLMRMVALIFEKKHADELKNMVASLCLVINDVFPSHLNLQVVECFTQINDDESDEQLSYGRLVALIAFAGMVAVTLCDMQQFQEISMIASYTSKFLHKRIALTWTQNRRSWGGFFDRVKKIIEKNEIEEKERVSLKSHCSCWWFSVRVLVIFGIFGIGAFTLVKTVSRTRSSF
ncbi:unnamed protein product [Thelazia callipaeda]|uniref:BCL domain-containing protein n=1 Tax=Thelazia callipaeda TaxID=103827 RepID=A0A0N5D246_THECL|nr:unnamed protein product [Thelazia callipaeda]